MSSHHRRPYNGLDAAASSRESSVGPHDKDESLLAPEIRIDGPDGNAPDEAEDEDRFTKERKRRSIPLVRKLHFSDFKNRYKANEVCYAIDVLVGGHTLEYEVLQEEKDREARLSQRRPRRRRRTSLLHTRQEPTTTLTEPSEGSEKPDAFDEPNLSSLAKEEEYIHQVRIQSPSILSFLSSTVKESWPLEPRVFFRPFKLLIHKFPEMKRHMEALEEKWEHQGDDTPSGSASPISTDGGGGAMPRASRLPLEDRLEAYQDMKCFIDFMERDILPLYRVFENLDATTPQNIRFDDLWYLFRHAELVYVPGSSETEKENSTDARQSIWRVYGIKTPFPRYRIKPADEHDHWRYKDTNEEMKNFRLFCYYIDYSGDEFCIVKKEFVIRHFTHERPISSLNIYPVRFMERKGALEEIRHNGENFLTFIEKKHLSYSGRSLTIGPTGEAMTDADGVKTNHADYIESNVIVDFVEAFQTCSSWHPEAATLSEVEPDLEDTDEGFPILNWTIRGNRATAQKAQHFIQLEDGVWALEWNRNLQSGDRFLVKLRENEHDNRRTTKECLLGDDLCLLPRRMYGYVLRDRKFLPLDVRKLKVVQPSKDGLNSLMVDRTIKKMIESTVRAHFFDKELRRDLSAGRLMTQDVISGKGNGTFILLHGVPGVGKTALAEAMAQSMGKPLFTITCGDLGITPSEVEKNLSQIFRLANLWDCVLLLDEVDTFFSERDRTDLVRTSIVAVFLRILEYYDGILFLTTNRIGTLDEAFRSRIQTTLYFPPLDYSQTMAIYKMNIERLRKIDKIRQAEKGQAAMTIHEESIMDFAEQNFRRQEQQGPDSIWSGRQIKDAFQSADSLARFMAFRKYAARLRDDPNAERVHPELDKSHFETKARLDQNFQDYMKRTTGSTATARAHDAGLRDDRFPVSTAAIGPIFRTAAYGPATAAAVDTGADHLAPPPQHQHPRGRSPGATGHRPSDAAYQFEAASSLVAVQHGTGARSPGPALRSPAFGPTSAHSTGLAGDGDLDGSISPITARHTMPHTAAGTRHYSADHLHPSVALGEGVGGQYSREQQQQYERAMPPRSIIRATTMHDEALDRDYALGHGGGSSHPSPSAPTHATLNVAVPQASDRAPSPSYDYSHHHGGSGYPIGSPPPHTQQYHPPTLSSPNSRRDAGRRHDVSDLADYGGLPSPSASGMHRGSVGGGIGDHLSYHRGSVGSGSSHHRGSIPGSSGYGAGAAVASSPSASRHHQHTQHESHQQQLERERERERERARALAETDDVFDDIEY